MCINATGGRRYKMSVLATPKKNSYIVKKAVAYKIINSKNSSGDASVVRERARKFALNNLKKNF